MTRLALTWICSIALLGVPAGAAETTTGPAREGAGQPKPRERLTVAPGQPAGLRSLGALGLDARWNEFGGYVTELTEIVQARWYHILGEPAPAPPRGSHVEVTFKLNAKGEVDILKVVDAGSGKQGVWNCQSALQARQPYRRWTKQMIKVLGTEQVITFGFYYQ